MKLVILLKKVINKNKRGIIFINKEGFDEEKIY